MIDSWLYNLWAVTSSKFYQSYIKPILFAFALVILDAICQPDSVKRMWMTMRDYRDP